MSERDPIHDDAPCDACKPLDELADLRAQLAEAQRERDEARTSVAALWGEAAENARRETLGKNAALLAENRLLTGELDRAVYLLGEWKDGSDSVVATAVFLSEWEPAKNWVPLTVAEVERVKALEDCLRFALTQMDWTLFEETRAAHAALAETEGKDES